MFHQFITQCGRIFLVFLIKLNPLILRINPINIVFVILALIMLCSSNVRAQDTDPFAISDSLLTAAPDTTTSRDTTKTKRKVDVDAVIYADASDSLTFAVDDKMMFIYGKGNLKYKQTELNSAKIYIDFNDNSLDAFGREDSTNKLVETPVLNEAGEVYEGKSLKYNFKTQRGFISMAKNVEEDKRYEGEKVKKVDKKTYFIEDGLYTTCPEDTPHTYFTAEKMKVIQGDKIIAEWVFMHVGGVPFPVPLPFGVFPNKSGRRSGIIVPTYGATGDRGQYFRNFGYFLALSDYYDATLTGDYYSKGGYGLRSRLRYKKRYEFSGNVNGGISNVTLGEEEDPSRSERFSWNLNVFHHHDITPTMKFDANLQFLSSEYLTDNSRRLNDLLRQDIRSNATFVKRWDESGNSLTINYSRNQNLQTGSISETLPNITFSKSQEYPFQSETSTRRNQAWYEYIGYTYSGQFRNERTKTALSEFEGGGFERNIRGGVQHSVRINAAPKIGYFNLTPSISYTEKWYDKRLKVELDSYEDSTGINYFENETVVKEISFVRTFDFNLSASTKIYGIAQPGILGIKAFRHTLEPRISYNYRPDFSEDKWGYYDSYIDENGNKIRYDKFSKGIFGGSGSGEQQSLNFSLGNIFEMKTEKDPTDTSSTEEKIQLLNVTASTGYNFAADSLRLRDLSLSFRTQVGSIFNLAGGSSFSFYDYDVIETGSFKSIRTVDRFLVDAGKGLMRLTNFNLNVSTSLAGSKQGGGSRQQQNISKGDGVQQEDDYKFDNSDYIELFDDESPDLSIPWNLSLNYNYNLNKSNPFNPVESSNIGLNLSMNLTEAWKITFRGNYDFIEHKLNAPQVTVYRDLHCWEMNFVWNPIGVYRGFRLEIRIKAPELQDIKVTKTKDIYSGF